MSWFGITDSFRGGDDSLWGRIFSRPRLGKGRKERKKANERRNGRSLRIDTLESRCLLSVTPSDLSAVIVNQTYGAAQTTNTAHSVTTDNNSDFVVTWTRTNSYTDANGTTFPVTDVYARYYTDTVQQVNLPSSLTTVTGAIQPTFSLRYNDQTIQQISVTAAASAPSGDPNPPAATNISGTFTLFFNATGNDTQGQMDATVSGGTQSNLLTVAYSEIEGSTVLVSVGGVPTPVLTGPSEAAAEIQAWLNAFAPVAANAATGFAGSDATHSTVNAIDPHTFVVDYGLATAGLDQSKLLQYIATVAPSATQNLTFTSTNGFVDPPVPPVNPNRQAPPPFTYTLNPVPMNPAIPYQFALQVGTVQTAPINFDSTNLAGTATAMQTALVAAGFTGATVTSTSAASPFTFAVTFTTPEPPVQYVSVTVPLQVSYFNSADGVSGEEVGDQALTGFNPSVTVTTLDKPFTISNIPFSQTNPSLTAQAIAGAFQSQVDSFSTGVAPVNFVSLVPQPQLPGQTPPPANPGQNPYTVPIYNNVGATGNALTSPVTGFNPTITVQPVVSVNTAGTDITSFTSFDITFTNVTGTTVDAPMSVTSYTTANGTTSAPQSQLIYDGAVPTVPGTVSVPTNATGATVAVLKQSGNEFQVNPPQPTSIYTLNQAPLDSSEPSVSMDGSGDFVISWTGQVSQQIAPKDVSNIYVRMYSPVGVVGSGTAVQGLTNSDLYQQQELTFNFTGAIPTNNTDTFVLQVGSFSTGPIVFNTDPVVTAANIQNALDVEFPGLTAYSSTYANGNPFKFEVTFAGGGVAQQPIIYLASASTLPSTFSYTTSPFQAFTGVRIVTNPTQSLTFNFTAGAPTGTGSLGTFQLQVGSYTTAPISFDSNTTVTALNIQNALKAAGFAGVAVSAPGKSSINPTFFTFNVTFAGYDDPVVQYQAITLPASVVFTNSNGDPYTIQVNANYTNPQFQSDVAMDSYGNFVVVWANQGPDESYFNDVSMQCFDNAGNPLGNSLVVDQDPLNPAIPYNTDTNFFPTVAIGLNDLNLNVPITDNIVVSWTTAIELPSQVATNPFGTVYVRGYSYNPEQKQGPAALPWNQIALSNNGGLSSVSLDGQNNFLVAWQQPTDGDSNTLTSEGVYAIEGQLLNYTSGTPLANPIDLRPTFRVNSSTTDTALQTVWPFTQEGADAQMTISGDIVTSFNGYGPQVAQDIAIPSSFYKSLFSFQTQQLTFNFVGGIPAFTAANDIFALQVGTVVTGPIVFNASPTLTANHIQTALVAAGFTGLTVKGTLAGNVYTFTVTFGIDPNEPNIQYVGALPATVTFTNSVSAPAAAQQITFTAATVPVTGLFELQVGGQGTAPIFFDSTNPTNTATNIQTALNNAGFIGATVAVDPASTATSFVFDVVFGGVTPVIALAAAPTLPSTLVYGATTTVPWLNADLLAYFNPLAGSAAAPIIGAGGPAAAVTLLYQDLAGSTLGQPTAQNNHSVNVAIDQVLFQAQYAPPAGTAAASEAQIGRLQAVLERIAGLLRGDANGVLTSQWDANDSDSLNSTYSDNIVSTQRDGQNQSFYLVVPYDVQQGTFQLQLTIPGLSESPNDVVPSNPVTITTGVITMPTSAPGGEPGGPILGVQSMESISAAIDAALGAAYGQGSVNVQEVEGADVGGFAQLNARAGTDFQVPTAVYNPAAPTASPINPAFITTATKLPAAIPNVDNAFIFELSFEGQAHDIPIGVGIINANDQQWIATKTITTTATSTQTTFSFAEGAATAPTVLAGDYAGLQGSPQYNASLAVTSAGSMVATYTSQLLQTDLTTPATDALGNNLSNIYYNSLAESTDIAGPHVVSWTDGNGVDLLNAPKATAVGVNASYMVLTFDEPMLADNPANDPDSIYNTANYRIYDSNGNLLSGVITHIDYGLSEVSQVASLYGFKNTNSTSNIPDNKWEVVLTINDVTNGGPLPDGTYTLSILAAEHALAGGQTGLCNIYGTPLNLTGYNQPTSVPFQATVTINKSTNPGGLPIPPGIRQTDTPINYAPFRAGQQTDPAVSSTNDSSGTALNGNYVVVWTSTIGTQTNIIGQMYKSSGVAIGGEFQVNTTASTTWNHPDVAMDAAGDFTIVWCGFGPNSNTTSDTSDIYARSFNANGQALTDEFEVDQYVAGVQQPGVQNQPRIGMSPDGTFVITWTGSPIYLNLSNVSSSNSAIFAREYDNADVPLGNEFQVTPSSSSARSLSDVSLDSRDDFIVTWEGDFQNSSQWGVYGDYFTAQGGTATTLPTTWTSGGNILLSQSPNTRGSFTGVTTVDLRDPGPRVAMDPTNGTAAGFVVTWANFTGPTTGYNIFAQQFGPGGTPNSSGALNTSQAIMVNPPQSQTGAGWQLMPAVGVDPEGDISVVWTVYGIDNANNGYPGILDYGIYTTLYYSSSSGKGLAGTNTGAFRVNATTLGDQIAPAVAFNDFENDALVAWVGPDTKATGTTAIFDRDIDPPNTPVGVLLPVTPAITAADTSVAVGTSANQAKFTITLSAPTSIPVTVNYATSNGTATAGTNYSPASGSLTFAPGQVSQTVAVNVSGITVSQPNKTLQLNLSSPSNATVARASATATITTAAPAITVSPSDQDVNLGQPVTFQAAATGLPAPTVQWQVSANGGLSYSNIVGATSSNYVFTPTAAMSGDLYQAVFTNVEGVVTTSAATLTVNTAPVITIYMNNKAVNIGSPVTLSAAATGTPTPTVLWQRSTNNGSTWTSIAGGTSTVSSGTLLATYTFTPTLAQAGLYRVIFTNSVGSATTNAATLTVHAAPVVTASPSSQAVTLGSPVSFSASATNTPAPTVQWQVSTNGTVWTNITGGTSSTISNTDLASYSFTPTAAQSGYQYRAVFTNIYGLTAITKAATLTVNSAPVVKTNPSSQTAKSGATVTFTAAATGSPTPTVQWQVSTNGGSTYSNIVGATSASYTITNVAMSQAGMYRAVFTNSIGTAATTGAALTVNAVPIILTNPVSLSVLVNASATFTASASGATTIQWQMSTNGGSTFSNIAGATSSSYVISKAATTQTGYQFRAVFTNTYGSVTTSAATLSVNAMPSVTTQPVSKTVTAGLSVTFTAAASGAPAPTVVWQILVPGGAWTNIPTATSVNYTFTATASQTGNQYRAVFTNVAGVVATTPATLTVNYAPVLKTAPTSQTLSAGHVATFTAAATSAPAASVQWQVLAKGSSTWTNVTGATSTTYSFTAATSQNGNQYRAVFTNSLGSLTTSAATLTVTSAVPIVPVQATTVTGTTVTNLTNSSSSASSTGATNLSANAVDAVLRVS
jgi:hypothetical protein